MLIGGQAVRIGGTFRRTRTRPRGSGLGRLRLSGAALGATTRERAVRTALLAGAAVLAMILLLSMCGPGGGADDARPRKPVKRSAPGPATRLAVPEAYDTGRGWEIPRASAVHALAGPDTLGYLERADATQFRLRTLNTATGRPLWAGKPWRPLTAPGTYPHLLSVTKGDRRYFVTWSYGKAGADSWTPAGTFVSLDVYDAEDGVRRRFEVPWADTPTVTGTGPALLITDGKARSATLDPETGEVTTVPPDKLGPPAGCADCRRLTEVHGVTAKGLLVGGAREFWVRGGWFSRNRPPSGAQATGGLPTSVVPGRVVARWQQKKGAKRAATHDIWAVHDSATGAPLVQVECRKPAIEPGDHPQAVLSPNGRYLIAGNLAFDLERKKGYCFEEADGTHRPSLATVTDDGLVYGAAGVRNAADALAGHGTPVEADLATGDLEPLAANVRLPGVEVGGVGIFRWTDAKDRVHLIGYPRRD
ncbi:hypothetical protein GCM10014713_18830 [Streptomyces purpureus]|uniref:Uncharacterized protein n=2 Tax=Streptomyces purpureus TaxID=1951 RepID=A0A918LND1_9ACTN|nr:hypothetical protein GCM10014713_18830 [Streptomyces purpureus]